MFSPLKILLAIFVFRKCEGSERSTSFELSVIHINDFHAKFIPTGPDSGICKSTQGNECIGGIARIYTASRQLLDERPNAIFLNAGDVFQGSLLYNLFKWNITVQFMNMLPHDVLTLGNHEFDDGIAGLAPFLMRLRAPVVVANIDNTREPALDGLYKKSTIIERGGRKIGVIGVIESTTHLISRTEKLIFLDEVRSVNAEAEELKARGVGIIIVLSHCGLTIERKMAANCPNIDIIVGGHSHSFLYTGPKPYTDNPVDEYPIFVRQGNGNRGVLIVQAGSYSRYIGNLSVWFDSRDEVIDWEGNPILLNHLIEEDPGVLAALQPWKEAADRKGREIIGSTLVYLDTESFVCFRQECNMGNLMTDALADFYESKNDTRRTRNRAVIIGVINAGAIRSSISNRPGSIIYEDIIAVHPFDNTVDLVEMRGQDIINTLEGAVLGNKTLQKSGSISFLQWSGLRITYNLAKPQNSRVVDVKVRCQDCRIPTYDNLVLQERYRVATINFLLDAGVNRPPLIPGYVNREIGPQIRDVLINFIRKKSPITYGTEGRITITWNN